MAQGDQYFLGYRQAEQERLQRQAQELAHEARWLLDQIGVGDGARVVEIGCGPQGCLDLLSERVGPTGSVVGVERNEDAANLARRFAADRKLANVQVLTGDARANGFSLRRRRQAVCRLAAATSEVTHPFIRARVWHSACRRTVRSEGGAALSVGRLSTAAKRPPALTPPA